MSTRLPLSGKGDRESALPAAVEGIMMSPGGGYAALTDPEGRSQVRSLTSFQVVWEQPADIASRPFLSFSPDDRFFAWGTAEAGVWILNIATGITRRAVEDVSGLSGIAVGANGSAVAWAHGGDGGSSGGTNWR